MKTMSQILGFFAVLGVLLGFSSSAHATGEVAALFALIDVAPVVTGVTALLGTLVVLSLIFLGYRYVKKSLNRG